MGFSEWAAGLGAAFSTAGQVGMQLEQIKKADSARAVQEKLQQDTLALQTRETRIVELNGQIALSKNGRDLQKNILDIAKGWQEYELAGRNFNATLDHLQAQTKSLQANTDLAKLLQDPEFIRTRSEAMEAGKRDNIFLAASIQALTTMNAAETSVRTAFGTAMMEAMALRNPEKLLDPEAMDEMIRTVIGSDDRFQQIVELQGTLDSPEGGPMINPVAAQENLAEQNVRIKDLEDVAEAKAFDLTDENAFIADTAENLKGQPAETVLKLMEGLLSAEHEKGGITKDVADKIIAQVLGKGTTFASLRQRISITKGEHPPPPSTSGAFGPKLSEKVDPLTGAARAVSGAVNAVTTASF